MAGYYLGQGTLINGGHANFMQTFNNNHYGDGSQHTLLQALQFPTSGLREQMVERQCRGTCEWFLETSEYLNWTRSATEEGHTHRMLWILGKAGSGKSTLLKFAIEQARVHAAKSDLMFTHFFNARGGMLERSVEGMYRTILVQILSELGHLSAALLQSTKGWMPGKGRSWPVPTLMTLLRTAIRSLQGRQLVFFIDALDECDNDEAQEMVEGFESLIEEAALNGQKFRVCFASRPYPHIATDYAEYFRLDDTISHEEDIKDYIEKHLRIGQSPARHAVMRRKEIKKQLLLKSKHVFLWAKLVVNLLNKEYRKGKPERYERWLQGSLGDLDKLYMEIWSHDNDLCDEEDRRSQILCLQWALYHIEDGGFPTLDPRELWWGIQLGLGEDVEGIWEKSRELDDAAIQRYITTTSKGFLESYEVFTTDTAADEEGDSIRNVLHKLDRLQISFIHESAREFVLSDEGPLKQLGRLNQSEEFELQGHLQLKDCCESLLEYCLLQPSNVFNVSWDNVTDFIDSRHELDISLPLFYYARRTIFNHANTIQRLQPDDHTQGEWTAKFYARFESVSRIFSLYSLSGGDTHKLFSWDLLDVGTEDSLWDILTGYGLSALATTTRQVLSEEDVGE